MKKLKKILLLFVILLGCTCIKARATEIPISINGADEIIGNTEGTLIVKINNNESVGVVAGKLSYNSAITDVKVSENNVGWTTTYNESTGVFNAINPKGVVEGEVIKITYKLKTSEQNGLITLSNIELITTTYETLKIQENVVKEVKRQETTSNRSSSSSTSEVEASTKEKSNNVVKTAFANTGDGKNWLLIVTGFVAWAIIIRKRIKSFR